MNAILNGIRLWYCDICFKTNNFSSRKTHINSKSHILIKEHDSVVLKHEVSRPEVETKRIIHSMIHLEIVVNFEIRFEIPLTYGIIQNYRIL